MNIEIEVIKNKSELIERTQKELIQNDEKQVSGINVLQKEILELQQLIEDLKAAGCGQNNNDNVQVMNSNPDDNNELLNGFKQLQFQLNKTKTNITDLTTQINKMAEKPDLELVKDDLEALRKEVNTIGASYVKKQEFEEFKNVEVPNSLGEINTQIEGVNDKIESIKGQILGLYDLLNKINSSDKKEFIEIPQINPVQNSDNGKLQKEKKNIKKNANNIASLMEQLSNQRPVQQQVIIKEKDPVAATINDINEEELKYFFKNEFCQGYAFKIDLRIAKIS